jgi:hypothetical protein
MNGTRTMVVTTLAVTLGIGLSAFAGAAPATAATTAPVAVWSKPLVSRTPQGEVTFHGPFSREEVDVTFDRLGRHDFVEITFHLLILRAWDGSVPLGEKGNGRPPAIGPDFFRLGLAGGPTLLYTTFSNSPDARFRKESLAQNYPSPVAGDLYEPQTGAMAKNTLGYTYPWAPPLEEVPMDATYRIRFMVPHRDDKLVLQLAGMNLQDLIDESWGVSNLNVRPLTAAEVKRPARDQIPVAFRGALDAGSPQTPAAFQMLVLGGDDSADWIGQGVKPQPVDVERVNKLVALLAEADSAKAARDAAALELRGLGARVEPLLRDARAAPATTPEQRQRIDWLLQGIAVTEISDNDVRWFVLATRALEVIGSPGALEVRRKLNEPRNRGQASAEGEAWP